MTQLLLSRESVTPTGQAQLKPDVVTGDRRHMWLHDALSHGFGAVNTERQE